MNKFFLYSIRSKTKQPFQLSETGPNDTNACGKRMRILITDAEWNKDSRRLLVFYLFIVCILSVCLLLVFYLFIVCILSVCLLLVFYLSVCCLVFPSVCCLSFICLFVACVLSVCLLLVFLSVCSLLVFFNPSVCCLCFICLFVARKRVYPDNVSLFCTLWLNNTAFEPVACFEPDCPITLFTLG